MTPSKPVQKQTVREELREQAERIVEAVRPHHGEPSEQAAAHPALAGEPVFRSEAEFSPQSKSRALVIMCSSARYRAQTEDFAEHGLGLSDYEVVAVPGGVQWLALPDILPKHNKVARWAAEFLIKGHNLARVICIAHDDCSAYEDKGAVATLAHMLTGKDIVEHQLDQLRHAGAELRQSFGVAVELYYASAEGGRVVFRKVE